jgi:hypothetical protein
VALVTALQELGRLATDYTWTDMELLQLGWSPDLRRRVEQATALMRAAADAADQDGDTVVELRL